METHSMRSLRLITITLLSLMLYGCSQRQQYPTTCTYIRLIPDWEIAAGRAIEKARSPANPHEVRLVARLVDIQDIHALLPDERLSQEEIDCFLSCPVVSLSIARTQHLEEVYHVFMRDIRGDYYDLPYTFPEGVSAYHMPGNLILLPGYYPGEPVDFVAVSADTQQFYAARVVPEPIIMQGKGDRRVYVEMDNPQRTRFTLYFEGFEPYEQVNIMIKCPTRDQLFQTNNSQYGRGRYTIYLSPSDFATGDLFLQVRGARSEDILITQLR